MTAYVNPFSGMTINPTQVGYAAYSIATNLTLEWAVNGNDQSPAAAILDIAPSVSGLNVALPPASQVSTGMALLVRNTGANAFNLTDTSGNLLLTASSGVAYFVWLEDNSTLAGTWANVTFGAGVSQANAVDLAGLGLVAVNSRLNSAIPATMLSSNYTFGAADRATFFVWESGVGTLTLPSSSAVGTNWFVIVRNNGTGILTLAAQGADTLDGAASAQLQPGESLVVVCTEGGASFNSFGYGRSSQFFYTQLALVLTGGTTTLTPTQAANVIQEYSGTLTSNATVVLPATVQLYSMSNNTTGAFTLQFTTGIAGGTTFALPQGQTAILICDGTNVYSATSASVITNTSITLSDGAVTSPSLNFSSDATTGLFLVGSGQLGVAVAGTLGFKISSAGMLVPVGISSGTF